MLWWDWNGKQRLLLFAAMLGCATVPLLLMGWPLSEWRAYIGGIAFLLIPQLVGFYLFVGLNTGRMPARAGSESRVDSPTWFWIIAAGYAAVVATFFGAVIFGVLVTVRP